MHSCVIIGADESEDKRKGGGPTDERDIGTREYFPYSQPLNDTDDKYAAHQIEKSDTDGPANEDKDLPVMDTRLRIPYNRVYEIVQPELGNHLKVGECERQAT